MDFWSCPCSSPVHFKTVFEKWPHNSTQEYSRKSFVSYLYSRRQGYCELPKVRANRSLDWWTRTVAVVWKKILCSHFCFPFWIWRLKRELFDLLNAFCVEHRLETFDLPLSHPAYYCPTEAGLCNEAVILIFLKWWRQKWLSSTEFLPIWSGVKIGQKTVWVYPKMPCFVSDGSSSPSLCPVFLFIFLLAHKSYQNGWMDFSRDPPGGSCWVCRQLEHSCACSSPSSLQDLLGRHACDSVVSKTPSPLPTHVSNLRRRRYTDSLGLKKTNQSQQNQCLH